MGIFSWNSKVNKAVDESEVLKKLKETQEELIQASKMISLGQMAAGAVHEIKNILFVIGGQIEVLETEDGLSPLVKQTVASIRKQVAVMQDIVRGILDFAKKNDAVFSDCDVNQVLGSCIELLKYQTKVRDNVKVVEELSGEALVINGNSNQLQEVFLNLMMNAAQAMEEKGGVLTLRSSKKNDFAEVEFCDTGKGMSEETRLKIFKPFFTTRATGTGLGLSLCLKIVENHQGSIDVASQEGVGTVFTVRLPLLKKN